MNEGQPAPVPGSDLLTVREAAERIRLSYTGTLGLVHRGVLPACKLGKSYRVRSADLERALQPMAVPAGKG